MGSPTMLAKRTIFWRRIPVTPVEDSGTWNPFQVAEIIVSNASSGAEVGARRRRSRRPTINCARCRRGLLDISRNTMTKRARRWSTIGRSSAPAATEARR
jgi:hypothetical protein